MAYWWGISSEAGIVLSAMVKVELRLSCLKSSLAVKVFLIHGRCLHA